MHQARENKLRSAHLNLELPTLFPCYAAADRSFVRDLADFLERGADIRVFFEEGELQAGETLTGKARDGLMADIILPVLSPDSVPENWVRTDWEESFVNGPSRESARIAFFRAGECRYPAVLARGAWFTDRRRLKRWVRTEEIRPIPFPSTLDELAGKIVDVPGVAHIASADDFLDAYSDDFDRTFLLPCANRSLAQIAGELGHKLGMRLDGEALENARRIREFCRTRRFLLVLQAANPEQVQLLTPEGRCSTLVTSNASRCSPDESAEMLFRDALRNDWELSRKLARQTWLRFAKQERFAELLESAQAVYIEAEKRGDRRAREEAQREQVWILERWGHLAEANQLRASFQPMNGRQLTLPLEIGAEWLLDFTH